MYCSLILPYLHYCIPIWGNTYKGRVAKIEILQKRAIRIIGKAGRYSHTLPLFKEFKLLKFYDIVYCSSAVLMYRVFNNDVPYNIKNMFQEKPSIKFYNFRSKYEYYLTTTKTKLKSHSFKVFGTQIWNNLKSDIKLKKTIQSFKNAIKRSIFENYCK